MKILILFFLCFISGIISGQVISSIKMDKVIIDSHLSDPLFTANKHVKQKFTTVSVVATDNSGNKKDSSTQVSDEMDVIINSKVIDVDHNHYPFDSCTSFYRDSTAMSHIAIQEKLNGSPVEWLEQVTEEQYAG